MEKKRSTVRDLRRNNRSTLLSKLYFDGPLSRQELSQVSGLSTATVSNVTAELVEERLVVEAGLVDSDGGRPRVLLRVDPAFAHVVGVDVGETGVKAELFDLTMGRLAAVELPLRSPRPDPTEIAELIATGLRDILAQAGVEEQTVLGVGIGLAGTVEQGARTVVHVQVIGWEAVPFEDLLRDRGVTLPLYLENGAKTQGQAELWFGAGRGARHSVIALVGSGVGAGVITDGAMYQGATSSAGEWGHTTIVYGGRQCRCGAHGCLEAYVGAEAILDRYREAQGQPPVHREAQGQPAAHREAQGQPAAHREAQGQPAAHREAQGQPAAHREAQGQPAAEPAEPGEQAGLAELLAAGAEDRAAAQVLDETAGYLGAGIANLINLFNPERIVLGGWAGVALGAVLLPRIREVAAAQALRYAYGQTTIELCELGPDAVAVGAATLPVAALLAKGGDPRRIGLARHRATATPSR